MTRPPRRSSRPSPAPSTPAAASAPGPLMELIRAIRESQVGDVIAVLSIGPAAPRSTSRSGSRRPAIGWSRSTASTATTRSSSRRRTVSGHDGPHPRSWRRRRRHADRQPPGPPAAAADRLARRRRSPSSTRRAPTSTSPASCTSPWAASARSGSSGRSGRCSTRAVDLVVDTVVRVDEATRTVVLAERRRSCRYDYLVLATGSRIVPEADRALRRRRPTTSTPPRRRSSCATRWTTSRAAGSSSASPRCPTSARRRRSRSPSSSRPSCASAASATRARSTSARRSGARSPSRASRDMATPILEREGHRAAHVLQRRGHRPGAQGRPEPRGRGAAVRPARSSCRRTRASSSSSTPASRRRRAAGCRPIATRCGSAADPNVFALGDATDLPLSKAGSTAHFEAPVVAEGIAAAIEGRRADRQARALRGPRDVLLRGRRRQGHAAALRLRPPAASRRSRTRVAPRQDRLQQDVLPHRPARAASNPSRPRRARAGPSAPCQGARSPSAGRPVRDDRVGFTAPRPSLSWRPGRAAWPPSTRGHACTRPTLTGRVFRRSAVPAPPVAVRGDGSTIETADGRPTSMPRAAPSSSTSGTAGRRSPRSWPSRPARLAYAHGSRLHDGAARGAMPRRSARTCRWTTRRSTPCRGGSEAMETALKMARAYHLARGETERWIVIARWGSYHGNTLGALDLSGRRPLRRPYEAWLGRFRHVSAAYPYRAGQPGRDGPRRRPRSRRASWSGCSSWPGPAPSPRSSPSPSWAPRSRPRSRPTATGRPSPRSAGGMACCSSRTRS